MASIAEVIDFLMSLMRDEDTRTEFDRNPDAALADRGLADVTGQDVRDARLMMADSGSAQPRADRPPERSGGSDDAVREIHYTTTHFEVGDVTTTVVTINDNDTVVVDSFNNDVVAIQDNDTTDIDVISIEDNDTVTGEEEGPEGEQGEEEELDPAAGTGAGLAGDLDAGEGAGQGGDASLGSAAGAGSGAGEGAAPDAGGEPIGVGDASEFGDETSLEDTDSGAGEGFAPDQDAGFGAQPELGAETGFTPDEPLDELVG